MPSPTSFETAMASCSRRTAARDSISPRIRFSRECRSSAIPEFVIGIEAFRDDAFQFRRPLDAHPDTRHEPRPGDHFIEDHAEAPDVGTVIVCLAAGLLGRHVSDSSHHDALPCAGNRGQVRLVCGRHSHLGEAEIEHFLVIASIVGFVPMCL